MRSYISLLLDDARGIAFLSLATLCAFHCSTSDSNRRTRLVISIERNGSKKTTRENNAHAQHTQQTHTTYAQTNTRKHIRTPHAQTHMRTNGIKTYPRAERYFFPSPIEVPLRRNQPPQQSCWRGSE